MRLVLALLLLAGCREGTSVLVRVDRGDVDIPADVAALHVQVTNPELSDATTFDSQVLSLCGANATSGCYTLPLSVALRPGDASPSALVRAEVTALDGSGNEVIHDAAEFHFTSGQQSTLDFYLSKACLMSACADTDQLCGRNGGCVEGSLGSGASADLASPGAQGTITRWAESEGISGTTDTPFMIQRPANAQTGDLLIATVLNGVAPTGWTIVAADDGVQLVYHRVGDAETAADYTFQSPVTSQAAWLAALYRGVGSVQVGGLGTSTVTHSFSFPSLEASAGSLLTTWFATDESPQCSMNGVLTEFNGTIGALDETPIAVTGQTGQRSYTCLAGMSPILGVELVLVP